MDFKQGDIMRTATVIALYIIVSFFTGCANNERINASIYEGLKTRNVITNLPAEKNPPEKSMSYQEYEAERKKLLENNDKK